MSLAILSDWGAPISEQVQPTTLQLERQRV